MQLLFSCFANELFPFKDEIIHLLEPIVFNYECYTGQALFLQYMSIDIINLLNNYTLTAQNVDEANIEPERCCLLEIFHSSMLWIPVTDEPQEVYSHDLFTDYVNDLIIHKFIMLYKTSCNRFYLRMNLKVRLLDLP